MQIMEVERSNSPSSYEEVDPKSSNFFNTFWFTSAPVFNSIRPSKTIVRHNFKSIDELLSLSEKNDDTGYNSQLSTSLQSQENDDIGTLKPTLSSTPHTKKNKIRTAFTDDQKQYLDGFYSTNRYPDPTQLETLSCLLSLSEKVIRVWFQNKRSRNKNRSMQMSSTDFSH